MSEKVLVTETLNEKGYCVRVTQRYSVDHDQGHWYACIIKEGHIACIRESGPAMPHEKISVDTCREILNHYLRSLEL